MMEFFKINQFEKSKVGTQSTVSLPSVFSHALLCTQGIYKNKSLTLSTTGDILGKATDERVTVVIHEESLAPIHAKLEYDQIHNSYKIKPLEGQIAYFQPNSRSLKLQISANMEKLRFKIKENEFIIKRKLYSVEDFIRIQNKLHLLPIIVEAGIDRLTILRGFLQQQKSFGPSATINSSEAQELLNAIEMPLDLEKNVRFQMACQGQSCKKFEFGVEGIKLLNDLSRKDKFEELQKINKQKVEEDSSKKKLFSLPDIQQRNMSQEKVENMRIEQQNDLKKRDNASKDNFGFKRSEILEFKESFSANKFNKLEDHSIYSPIKYQGKKENIDNQIPSKRAVQIQSITEGREGRDQKIKLTKLGTEMNQKTPQSITPYKQSQRQLKIATDYNGNFNNLMQENQNSKKREPQIYLKNNLNKQDQTIESNRETSLSRISVNRRESAELKPLQIKKRESTEINSGKKENYDDKKRMSEAISSRIIKTSIKSQEELPETEQEILVNIEVKDGFLAVSTKETLKKRVDDTQFVNITSMDKIQLGNMEFKYQRLDIGRKTDIGTRKNNEDGILIIEDLKINSIYVSSLLCVIDGQGGIKCCRTILDHLTKFIKEQFKTTPADPSSPSFEQQVISNLRIAVLDLDALFLQKYPNVSQVCGATITFSLLFGNKVFTCWLGDCQAFVLTNQNQLVLLTDDHIPSRLDEEKRVSSIGGKVEDGRISGMLTISRCLGQFEFKQAKEYQDRMYIDETYVMKSLLSSEIQTCVYDINPQGDNCLCIFTDGLLNVMTQDEIANFIASAFKSDKSPQQICEDIVDSTIKLSDSRDNSSIIILKFQDWKEPTSNIK